MSADASRRWSDLRTRVISAAVLVPVGLGCLYLGGPVWDALLLVACVGLASEWARLCAVPRLPAASLAGSVALCLALSAAGRPGLAVAALVPLVGLVWLAVQGRAGRPLAAAAGVLWLAPAAIALVWLRTGSVAGLGNVLFLLIVVWSSDIGAYMAGRWIGGPKLAPAISPAKTWAGALGGLLAAMAGGAVLVAARGGAPLAAVAAAVPLAMLAQAGDLLESGVKRWIGVKDSGWLIPGHGGLLDRLDGVLAAAPAAALFAWCLGAATFLWQ